MDRLHDERHLPVDVDHLEVSPCAHGLHLRIFRQHVLDVGFHLSRVGVCDVEVAVVDDLIVVADVEHGAASVLGVLEVGDGMQRVGDVLRAGSEVASHLVEDDLPLCQVLHAFHDSQIGIEGVVGVHVGFVASVHREHVVTGCSGSQRHHQQPQCNEYILLFHVF